MTSRAREVRVVPRAGRGRRPQHGIAPCVSPCLRGDHEDSRPRVISHEGLLGLLPGIRRERGAFNSDRQILVNNSWSVDLLGSNAAHVPMPSIGIAGKWREARQEILLD